MAYSSKLFIAITVLCLGSFHQSRADTYFLTPPENNSLTHTALGDTTYEDTFQRLKKAYAQKDPTKARLAAAELLRMRSLQNVVFNTAPEDVAPHYRNAHDYLLEILKEKEKNVSTQNPFEVSGDLKRAEKLFQERNFEEAERLSYLAVLNPQHSDLWMKLGDYHFEQGNLEKASRFYGLARDFPNPRWNDTQKEKLKNKISSIKKLQEINPVLEQLASLKSTLKSNELLHAKTAPSQTCHPSPSEEAFTEEFLRTGSSWDPAV